MKSQIQDLQPLRLGQPQYKSEQIRLNLSEDIQAWPQHLLQQFWQQFNPMDLNYYPVEAENELKQRLYQYLGLDKAIDIIFGNGSFELLNCLFQLYCPAGTKILTANPDFFIYKRLATLNQCELHSVDVDCDLNLDVDQFITATVKLKPEVIFLSNPNNPTTKYLSTDTIESIVTNTDAMVIIDEAYIHYAGKSCASLINQYDNLIVVQTLSKIGLAGLRLGYLLCQAKIAKEINTIRMPFSVNTLSLQLAGYLFKNELINTRVNTLIKQRRNMLTRLNALPHAHAIESKTNFINLRVDGYGTKALYQALLAHNIVVTPSNIPGFLPDYIRISVTCETTLNLILSILEKCRLKKD